MHLRRGAVTHASAGELLLDFEYFVRHRTHMESSWSGKVDQRGQLARGVHRVEMIPVDACLSHQPRISLLPFGFGHSFALRRFAGRAFGHRRAPFGVCRLAVRWFWSNAVAQCYLFTGINSVRDSPWGSAYARSANESTDGSATEIAPCRLSLVVGVEFPKYRFDGVRVGPCFFVEDEFFVRSPDHHSVLTAIPLYPRRASSSLTNLQSSAASGAAPSTVTVTIPSSKDTSTSRQSRSPQFTVPPISDRFSTASARISSTAAWSAMASSLVIFRKTSCVWFAASSGFGRRRRLRRCAQVAILDRVIECLPVRTGG